MNVSLHIKKTELETFVGFSHITAHCHISPLLDAYHESRTHGLLGGKQDSLESATLPNLKGTLTSYFIYMLHRQLLARCSTGSMLAWNVGLLACVSLPVTGDGDPEFLAV